MITFEGRNIVVRHLYILYFITFTAKLRPQHESSPLSLGEGSGGEALFLLMMKKRWIILMTFMTILTSWHRPGIIRTGWNGPDKTNV